MQILRFFRTLDLPMSSRRQAPVPFGRADRDGRGLRFGRRCFLSGPIRTHNASKSAATDRTTGAALIQLNSLLGSRSRSLFRCPVHSHPLFALALTRHRVSSLEVVVIAGINSSMNTR